MTDPTRASAPSADRPHMPADWRGLSREALDFQYSPSRIAKDFDGALKRYADLTRAAKARPGLYDQAYGPGLRQTLDVFPASRPGGKSPVHVFIHGGFWQALSKEYGGFAAPAFTAAGSAFIAVNYTLAPEASLRQIVTETRAALDWVIANAPRFGADPERIVVSGHSAGGYLAASLIAGPLAEAKGAMKLAGLLPISGVYDLTPIQAAYVNDAMGLNPAETASLDLMTATPRAKMPLRLAVGGEESAEFQRQSRELARAWEPHLPGLECITLPGRDHFDILFDLSEPQGPLFRAAMALAGLGS